jgi:ABC-type lipoprotein release transport system permease subunit
VASQLPGARASDPAVLALVALVITAVAMLASWVPARRAMRASPLAALRAD